MLPWWLYALTPRDQSQPVIRIWNQADTISAFAATVEAVYVVPDEQVAILHNYSVDQRGGAAQTPTFVSVEVTDGSRVYWRTHRLPQTFAGAPLNSYVADTLNGMLVPGGYEIHVAGVFQAGAVANTIFTGLGATLIPRGTIQSL